MAETMTHTDGRNYRLAWRLWLATLALPGLGGVGLGAWLILDDLGTSGEFLDGLGVAIGIIILGVAAVALVLIGVAEWISARHPKGAVVVAGALVLLVALAVFTILRTTAPTGVVVYTAAALVWLAGFVSLSSTVGRWPTT